MVADSVDADVLRVMEDILGVSVTAGTTIRRATTPQWDSLSHVELVFLLESTFGIVLDVEDIGELDSSTSLIEAVRAARGIEVASS